ncbi:MAG: protein phosphatase CheZ [Candidatus Kapabacteria bacterium]|nr:protein phosphatase CheZ [Candidatus Kapabacteria bacterium]
MAKDRDIQVLLTKSEELKALFTLGQRVIPFLEELFIFVREVTPALEEINTSIQDNLKRIPKASKQLSKVTEATELATNEIMDIIDGMTYKLNVMNQNMKDVQTRYYALQHACSSVAEIAKAGLSNGQMGNPYLTKIEAILNEESSNDTSSVLFANSESVMESVRTDTNNIMLSLQVQDITTQQIAAVNHVIETVQGKLNGILGYIQNSEVGIIVGGVQSQPPAAPNKYMPSEDLQRSSASNSSTLHREIAFDPEAVDSLGSAKLDRQNQVDDLLNAFHSNSLALHEADIPEVDDAVSGASPVEVSVETSAAALTELDADDPVDTTDIDALFASMQVSAQPESATAIHDDGIDPMDEVSQDDIDALFK